MHLFGLYINPRIFIQNIGFTNNIYRYDEKSTPDWTLEPGIDLGVGALIGSRVILKTTLRPYYSFFLKNSQERSWSYSLKGDFHTYLSSFNLHFGVMRRWERSLPSREFGIRVRNLEEGLRGDIDWGNQENLFITLYYEHNRHSYEDENYLDQYNLRQIMDHSRDSLGIRIHKRIFSRTKLFFDLRNETYQFIDSSVRDVDSRTYSIGLVLPQAGRLQGIVTLGIREVFPENAGYRSFRNPWGTGEIQFGFSNNLIGRLTYLSDFSYSIFSENLYYQNRTWGGSLEWYLSTSLKLRGGYIYNQLAYQTFDQSDVFRHDRVHQVSAGFFVRILRGWAVGVEWINFRSDSSESNFRQRYSFIGGSIRNEF